MPWLMAGIKRGAFEVVNPYSRTVSTVPADPGRVHSIVFWSKNFGPFLESGYGPKLRSMGYGLFFNFTVNSERRELEPKVPPLDRRLEQMAELARRFGPECIHWRFDPICLFRTAGDRLEDNLGQFDTIARQAARAGIGTCITSFVDRYRKVLRRFDARENLELIEPAVDRKTAIIVSMAERLRKLDIRLRLCCEKALLEALPPELDIGPSACIPGDRLAALYGPGISMARDTGQRKASGCRCTTSRDIGSYSLHPCLHDCLFCYANPAMDGTT
jgi:hypothetical protein